MSQEAALTYEKFFIPLLSDSTCKSYFFTILFYYFSFYSPNKKMWIFVFSVFV